MNNIYEKRSAVGCGFYINDGNIGEDKEEIIFDGKSDFSNFGLLMSE